MMRLILALVAATTLAFTQPARAAEMISLDEITGYLNNLTTARGNFTQINPDGTISTGKIFIPRPGRIRFDYEEPDPALVMAGGGRVAIIDRKSNEPPQQYPLKRTPLSVILADNVDLSRANMITGHSADDVSTKVTAQDPENPDIGYIELVFTPDPVELRQWVITDDMGNQTTVILGDIERDVELGDSLFSVVLELDELNQGDR